MSWSVRGWRMLKVLPQPVLSLYREQAIRVMEDAIDNVLLNGDTEAGATGNINSDDEAPAATNKFMAFDGLRKLPLVTTTANKLDAAGAPTASLMRQALAPLVDAVALFMDNPAEHVREVVRQVRPTLLQFHGSEDDAFCRSFGVPYMKAIAMGSDIAQQHPGTLHSRYPAAAGFLFDSHGEGEPGGSGEAFDWARIPAGVQKPFVLAGGLSASNVFDAIQATLPWGVDVSSGIESAPGIKDGDLMRRFVEEVRRSDCRLLE